MFAAERKELIMGLARERGRVDVVELAKRLAVTTETIRRDLTLLEQQGVLKRVHGGAVVADRLSVVPDLAHRSDIMASAKRAIGRQARHHVPKSGSILIDAGSTTVRLADMLPPDCQLTVVTNAAPTAEALVRNANVTVFLLGGRVRRQTLATVDSWALDQLKSLHVDVAFIGTYGVSTVGGFSTPDPAEAAVKRAMVRASNRVIVLADRTKIGASHLSTFASLDEVDLLITDSGADGAVVKSLGAAGLSIELSRDLPSTENGSPS